MKLIEVSNLFYKAQQDMYLLFLWASSFFNGGHEVSNSDIRVLSIKSPKLVLPVLPLMKSVSMAGCCQVCW